MNAYAAASALMDHAALSGDTSPLLGTQGIFVGDGAARTAERDVMFQAWVAANEHLGPDGAAHFACRVALAARAWGGS